MGNILNSNKNGLSLFEDGIIVNKSLTKWKNVKEGVTKTGNRYLMPETFTTPDGATRRMIDVTSTNTNSITIINDAGWVATDIPNVPSSDNEIKLSDVASMELRELNDYINKTI